MDNANSPTSHDDVTAVASASITVEEACALEFEGNQGKNYHKEGFILHSRVAEVIGLMISDVFYDDATRSWSVSPQDLRDLVISNIHYEGYDEDGDEDSSYARYPIYGSAIAFEPNVLWDVTTDGLEEGVTYPASSEMCLETANDDPSSPYCSADIRNRSRDSLLLTQLNRDPHWDNATVYCPYAFRGPPTDSAYQNCSSSRPEYCPSMDLSYAYKYWDTKEKGAEWYTAPRCLYLRNGIKSGYWTSPYFDEGAGNINMVTYSQPMFSRSGTFLGITTIDIEGVALCYGEQCSHTINYHYITNIRPVGYTFASIGMVISILLGGWTHFKRTNAVIKASQPFFLIMICMGCFIMTSSIIPLSIEDDIASVRACNVCCMMFPWLLSLGFCVTFSALFSKIWRLNHLMQSAARFQSVIIKEKDALVPCAILLTCNCAILISWTVVSPMVWIRTEPDSDFQSYGKCIFSTGARSWQSKLFLALIFSVNALALLLANIEAYKARKISTKYLESSYIMMIMVVFSQILVLGAPLLALVSNQSVPRYFLLVGMIFGVTSAVLGLIFGPKWYAVHHAHVETPIGFSISNGQRRNTDQMGQSNTAQNGWRQAQHKMNNNTAQSIVRTDRNDDSSGP